MQWQWNTKLQVGNLPIRPRAPLSAGCTLILSADMKQERKSLSPVLADSIDEHASVQIDEAKLVRKIDLRVLPMLFIIYVAAFLDRCVCCFMEISTTEPAS